MSDPNTSVDPVDVDKLVGTLNDLLVNLGIPIPIDTPLDLTPSLLLAVLETILQSRLPISPAVRKSRDLQSKVQAMKIFLGVLESDVLGEDVGLSDVDPRKLAEGEWDEVVFVGELLCWLGKKHEIIPVVPDTNARASGSRQQEKQWDVSKARHTTAVDVGVRTPSPTTHSTATTIRDSLLSVPRQSDTSMTTMSSDSPSLSVLDLFDTHSSPILEHMSRIRRGTVTPPPRGAAQCIHEHELEVQEPSFMNMVGHSTSIGEDSDSDGDITTQPPHTPRSFRRCSSDEDERTPKRATPVRYSGWISEADEELEIRSFEESRRKPHSHSRTPPLLARSTQSDPDTRERFDLYAGVTSTSTPRRPSASRTPSGLGRRTPSGHIVNRHTSNEHTLALFNERARLMTELASVRSAPRQRVPQR
ncbi:hypothetical protein EUX98_g5972 [Antrodiella citrinella]|uniref:DUF5745 domain-containing protein n=1 Tax=Antrodiella citrinella TaxID=2447956 RepID=A0A4S4MR58_9APHY|nr:hypothetical protein EUX98_g5972 [Antrodiella citrinella]